MDTLTYQEKLDLIYKVERNIGMLDRLRKKEMPEKVEYLLRKHKIQIEKPVLVIEKPPPPPPAPPEPPAPQPQSDKWVIVRSGREVRYENLPPRLRKLWDENRDNYKLIRSLHEKLKLMDNLPATAREPLCGEIASRDVRIRMNWKEIDEWTPGMPEPDEIEKPKIEMDYKRINANRKYISKNLRKLTENNIVKIQERYDELKNAGIEMNPKTLAELKAAGINL